MGRSNTQQARSNTKLIKNKQKQRKASAQTEDAISTKSFNTELLGDIIDLLVCNNQVLNSCQSIVTQISHNCGSAPLTVQQRLADKMIRRETCVQVKIKCNFLRIISIDTMKQEFEADVFIQAKWHDPVFSQLEGTSTDIYDEKEHWRPHLVIKNCDSQLTKETVTMTVYHDPSKIIHPQVIMGWKFQAVLKECLELENYPVDVQDLTVQLSSEHTSDEVLLDEDTEDLSTVNVRSFPDAQEWRIYNHVVFEALSTRLEFEQVSEHPLLLIRCRVARRLWYFLWNIVFIMFVICCLTFSCYAIPTSSTDRLAVNITLMLTGVTFKLVVTQSLPKISYLTYLDIYVLFSLVFLGLYGFNNALMIHLSTTVETQKLHRIDKAFVFILLIIMILFHVLYGLRIYFKTRDERKLLKHQDVVYLTKLKELGKIHSSSVGELRKAHKERNRI